MQDQFITDYEKQMDETIDSFNEKLIRIRTGRANPHILDKVQVDYYGVMTPINQAANITAPEATQIIISPYDRGLLKGILTAVQKANLGFNPVNTGEVIRISIPQPTQETRRELVKELHKMTEEAKVKVRNIRRKANSELKKLQKDSEITEDDFRDLEDDMDKLTTKEIEKINKICKAKEEDVMLV